MTIRRPGLAAAVASTVEAKEPEAAEAATVVTANPLEKQEGERELLEASTRIEKGPVQEWSDEAPTQVRISPELGEPSPPAKPAFQEPQKSSAPKVVPISNQAPNDMLLALVGTFASAGGALLLATNTAGSSSQRMLGLGIALWGALTCLFLLVTGNLWRQKGSMSISIALATVLAVGGAGFVEVALHDADIQQLVRGSDSTADTPSPAVLPAPVDAPEPESGEEAVADAEAGEEATGEEATGEEAVEAPAEAEATRPPPVTDASASRTTTPVVPVATESLDEELDLEELEIEVDTRSVAEERRRVEMEDAAKASSDKRTRREEERARKAKEAKEAKERAARTAAPAATGTAKMKSLPLTVVDTLIRTNMTVKKCFFEEKSRSGSVPRRVAVRFTVLTSGRVTSARVITDQYKGTPLDSCLGRAFKAIQFPPFEGETVSMTYPFVL
jgi:outer membrane biosynthesis protein TonB